MGKWWSVNSVLFCVLTFLVLFISACKHKAKQDNLAADDIWWEHYSQHWRALFYLQSDSNGMLWPGCGQAQLCPKVLTVADELIHVNFSTLHTSSSAQLRNGWILQLPSCKVWQIPDKNATTAASAVLRLFFTFWWSKSVNFLITRLYSLAWKYQLEMNSNSDFAAVSLTCCNMFPGPEPECLRPWLHAVSQSIKDLVPPHSEFRIVLGHDGHDAL